MRCRAVTYSGPGPKLLGGLSSLRTYMARRLGGRGRGGGRRLGMVGHPFRKRAPHSYAHLALGGAMLSRGGVERPRWARPRWRGVLSTGRTESEELHRRHTGGRRR